MKDICIDGSPPLVTAPPVLQHLVVPTLRRTLPAGIAGLVITPQHRESLREGSQDLHHQILS